MRHLREENARLYDMLFAERYPACGPCSSCGYTDMDPRGKGHAMCVACDLKLCVACVRINHATGEPARCQCGLRMV